MNHGSSFRRFSITSCTKKLLSKKCGCEVENARFRACDLHMVSERLQKRVHGNRTLLGRYRMRFYPPLPVVRGRKLNWLFDNPISVRRKPTVKSSGSGHFLQLLIMCRIDRFVESKCHLIKK